MFFVCNLVIYLQTHFSVSVRVDQYQLEYWFFKILNLKFHNKLVFFHIFLDEKSQRFSLTIIESQKLPNLQNFDVDSQITKFEWTLHNGRRKIHRGFRSDTKKIEHIEYRRNENQWKKINLYNYKEKNMISYSIYFRHY